jgi:hypothetical protein
MTSNIVTGFNDHFMEFVTDIENVFPDDHDILVAKNSLLAIRKANPKMIIKIWYTFIVSKYKDQIDSGDISFFINKDYSDDLTSSQNSSKIISCINRLKEPIKNMSKENQEKTMKYIQNLTKLSDIYNKTGGN